MTAKTDRLIVREPGLPLQRSLLVFWDKTASAALTPDAADALAESVSSVCQSLSEQGYDYQLGWPEGGTAGFAEAGSTEELLRDLPLLLRGGADGALRRSGGERNGSARPAGRRELLRPRAALRARRAAGDRGARRTMCADAPPLLAHGDGRAVPDGPVHAGGL